LVWEEMRLYYARRFIVLEGRGHPPGAILYLDSPDFELRVVNTFNLYQLMNQFVFMIMTDSKVPV